MNHSPAQILAQLLQDEMVFTVPADGEAWPVYVSSMPDGAGVKDVLAAVYDTTGIKSGRILDTGINLFAYGFQVKIRALDYEAGWQKAQAVEDVFTVLHNQEVTIDETTYLIDCITQTSPILSLGQDEKRRPMFAINGVVLVDTAE